MRTLSLIALAFLAACSNEANHLGNPLLLPLNGLNTAIGNAAYNQQRGQVEIAVKSSWPTILKDIENGQGPILTEAMNLAGIPENDRPARILQLQGDLPLYQGQPENLIVALMVYGS